MLSTLEIQNAWEHSCYERGRDRYKRQTSKQGLGNLIVA